MTPIDEVRPSRLFLRFFQLFCDPRLVEDIEGDLLERFEIRLRKKGQRKAKWLFIKDVMALFRPGIIRNFSGFQKLNNYDMFKNYFKVAVRNLLRQKMYSFIKVGGFSLGIAVCLLISLFIRDEFSYNLHITDHEQLYMVVKEFREEGGSEKYTWHPAPFGEAILNDFPEVLASGRILVGESFGAGSANLRKAEEPENFFDKGLAYADQSILTLFDYKMVYGEQEKALAEPQTMVLTKSRAEMLYPGENPLGRVIYIDENKDRPYKVGGVIEDLPENSTFKFNYLMTMEGREFWPGEQNSWGSNNYQVFVKLREDADLENLNPRLKEIGIKYVLPTYKRAGYADAEAIVESMHFELLALKDIHLNSAEVVDPFVKSDIKYVLTFGLIAFFILLLACINFINLATAKSANRAKEVGLRKTIGSTRSHLISQFLSESTVYSLLSFIIALGISVLILPYFNQLAEKSISIPWTAYWFLPVLFIIAVLIGFLAGMYPAFYLSNFKPVAVLKGKLSMGSKSSGLRNSLVVFQFIASTVLIIGTFVVHQQIQYMLNRDIGFDKERVVLVQSPYLLGDNMQSFKNELNQSPEISSTSYSGFLPISGTNRNGNTWWNDGRTKIDPSIAGQNWIVDYEYLETLGMDLVAGRNFSREMKSDSASVIINETMAKQLGILDHAINKRITNRASNNLIYNVIGVVKDFNYEMMTDELEPLAMRLGLNSTTAVIKLNTEDVGAAIELIADKWQTLAPNQPFIYDFLDQRFGMMYAKVTRTKNILTAFTLLAIVIACLGLFGLSVFMVEQRGKEISVRLVLGAKTIQIVSMLSINFMKPIMLALIIATPISWYLMQNWLNDYEYNAGLNPGMFIVCGLAALAIALATISFQSIKAAFTSPVQGLRNE